MISFKGPHYPKSVMLYALFFYVRYGVSYRDPEKTMAEVDHAMLNRWVVKYAPPTSRCVAHGHICTVQLIATVKPLNSFCLRAAIRPLHDGFSNEPLAPTVSPSALSSTRAALILLVCKISASSSNSRELAEIEAAQMIRKGQIGQTGTSAFKQFEVQFICSNCILPKDTSFCRLGLDH